MTSKLSKDSFQQRERNLEDEFFYRVDQELNRRLREKMATEAGRKRLAEVVGLSDQETLDQLMDVGVTSETVAALTLVPLVVVAWADRIVDSRERNAVLKAAHESGLSNDSASWQLLSHWLHNKPSGKLFSAWKSYVEALTPTLSAAQLQRLKKDISDRTREVAEAAGGILGLGRVSKAEEKVINEVEQAFQPSASS